MLQPFLSHALWTVGVATLVSPMHNYCNFMDSLYHTRPHYLADSSIKKTPATHKWINVWVIKNKACGEGLAVYHRRSCSFWHFIGCCFLTGTWWSSLERQKRSCRPPASLCWLTVTRLTAVFILVQESKRSAAALCGRTDGNVKVIFPKEDVSAQPAGFGSAPISAGDYVLVKVGYGSCKHVHVQFIFKNIAF